MRPGGFNLTNSIRAIGWVVILTVAVRLLGLGREMALAYRFGVSESLDVFLLILLLATLPINLIGGAAESALVPRYISLRSKGQGHRALAYRSTLALTLLLLVVVLGLAIFGPWVFKLLFSSYAADHALPLSSLFLLLAPVAGIASLAIVLGALLNAEGLFGYRALSPALVSIAIIAGLLLSPTPESLIVLAAATLIGYSLEFLYLGYKARKFVAPARPFKDSNLLDVNRAFWPFAAAATLTAVYGIVDQTMAGWLGNGAVATLSYGNRVPATTLSLMAASWTVLFPKIAEAVGEGKASVRVLLKKILAPLFFSAIAVMVPALIFSEEIVKILFERGAFDQNATKQVAMVQLLYMLQVPFYTMAMIFSRVIAALESSRVVFHGWVIALIANVALNWVLMKFWGVAGIALSTSIVFLGLSIFWGTWVKRALREESL